LQYGSEITEEEYIAAEIERIRTHAAMMVKEVKERAKEIEVTRGVTLVKPATNTASPPIDVMNTLNVTNTLKATNVAETTDTTSLYNVMERFRKEFREKIQRERCGREIEALDCSF